MLLTLFSDPLDQHVELVHKHLLLAGHHPGEALLQHPASLDHITQTALQLLHRLLPHQGTELGDSWFYKHTWQRELLPQ